MGERTGRLRQNRTVTAVRGSTRRRLDRVGGAWLELLQTGAAAAAAWELARLIVGQPQPFFAPIAAVLALGLSRGHARLRAVELALGVALGIAIADLLVRAIGTGTWQIGVVVVLAMAAALVVGAGTLLVNQAAVSAILVITLPANATVGDGVDRLFDALIGAAVALLFSQVLFPRDPVRRVGKAAGKVLGELATALEETAVALDRHDDAEAARALARARALNDEISAFYDALAVGRENAWLSPTRRQRALGHLRAYADAARQVDYAVRNTRILARNAGQAIRAGPVDPDLPEAVSILADAVRALAEELAEPGADAGTRRLARQASDTATAVLDRHDDLRTSLIVGQVRATAADLLRGTGLDTGDLRLRRPPS